jgi:uncharacterized protein (UPF0332 family)
VSNGLSPALYLSRSERALASAKLLLGDGDTDGASSRAYYAMFDAAIAALTHVSGNRETRTKSHSGLIAAVGEKLVQTGRLSPEFGRMLNQVHELRLAADYLGDPVPAKDASWAVSQSDAFVAAIRLLLRA